MNDAGDALAKLLEEMGTDGWDAIENAGAFSKQLNERQALEDDEQRRQEATIVHAALATPAGRQFLTWLVRKTFFRPPAFAETSATTAEAYAIAKARREGQNGVVFMLLDAMSVAAKARRRPGTPEDGAMTPEPATEREA